MTLVITNTENAPIQKYGDHILCSGCEQFLYGGAIFSRVAQLSLVDMLYAGVINSDYERFAECLKQNGRLAAAQSLEAKEKP